MNINPLRSTRDKRSQNPMRSNLQNDFSSLVRRSLQNAEKNPANSNSASASQQAALQAGINVHQAKRAEEVTIKRAAYQPEVTFSGSYQERLDQISKLNAETDWSSMDDVEKVKTFEDRYRQAFGGEKFLLTMSLYTLYSKEYQEISDSYTGEMQKYFGKEGLFKLESEYSDCYRKAYYGDASKEEVRAALMEKWQGTGSMEDKFAMLEEFCRCRVDKRADHEIQYRVERELFDKVEGVLRPQLYGTGIPATGHPRFLQTYMTYAKGVGEGADFKLNWTQLAQSVMDMYEAISRSGQENAMSPEELDEMRNMLDDFLEGMLGKGQSNEK